MGKTKKNSNYQTAKKEAERLAKEAEIKREKRKKLTFGLLIPAVAMILVTAIVVLIIGYNKGWFKEKFSGTYYATIIFDEFEGIDGNFEVSIELYGDEAPITVENFIKLCKEGYYDGTYFHRYVKNFCLQGGGSSKPCDSIKGEFKENGVDNGILHEEGVISMARANSYDSASSQFFFVLETSADNSKLLDGKYAAFGKVVAGWGYIELICSKLTPGNNISSSVAPTIRTVLIETPAEYNARRASVE